MHGLAKNFLLGLSILMKDNPKLELKNRELFCIISEKNRHCACWCLNNEGFLGEFYL